MLKNTGARICLAKVPHMYQDILLLTGFIHEDVLYLASTLVIFLPFIILPAGLIYGRTGIVMACFAFVLSVIGYRFGYYPYEFVDSLGLDRLIFDYGAFGQQMMDDAQIQTDE